MPLEFIKMHALGNDFVIIDMTKTYTALPSTTIKKLANRRLGVGFDQLLILKRGSTADTAEFAVDIYNTDGSKAYQCGNGIRCMASFIWKKKLTKPAPIRLKLGSAFVRLRLTEQQLIEADMGKPQLTNPAFVFEQLNSSFDGISYELNFKGNKFLIVCCFLGNPHAVILTDAIDDVPINELGAHINIHPAFPEGCNLGFMELVNRTEIKLRVYERGVGETLACGSGACAAVIAGHRYGLLDEMVNVAFKEGNLKVKWQNNSSSILLIGDASYVFTGTLF